MHLHGKPPLDDEQIINKRRYLIINFVKYMVEILAFSEV